MDASSSNPGISRRGFFKFAAITLAVALVPAVVMAQDDTGSEANSEDDPPH